MKSKKAIATELKPVVQDANELARDLGLDPYPVNYWIVDHDEMNQLIAYDGFQNRYPHWRWGMKYDKQRKQDEYFGGKAFEIVNSDNPAAAFLQQSNSIADQKAVITHVEAHSDFFKNNQWFEDDPNAAAMLERHADKIEDIIQDEDVSREEVEKWIDHIQCIIDTIDQQKAYTDWVEWLETVGEDEEADVEALEDALDNFDLSEEVQDAVFDEEWLEEQASEASEADPVSDVLAFLLAYGKQYDDDQGKAVEYEEWQQEVLALMHRESHYFAPQKMTKVMNEGWAAYWQSLMMGNEQFADEDEFIEHADHISMVLNSPGFNPYQLGKQLWEYIENARNRREVVERLLRVDGITWQNFHNHVDFDHVLDQLAANADEDVLVETHYSLLRPQNRGFLKDVGQDELKERARYLFDDSRYESIEAALEDVEYEVGWERMREIRRDHNDTTFLDEFLTEEFITENDYFAYEFDPSQGQHRVSSTDAKDVKQKLLLQFTNFGKPTIVAADANHNNAGELLLHHEYNGIILDLDQAVETLKRVFDLWGRPVNLKTIVKNPDTSDEEGRLLRYTGEDVEVYTLDWDDVADIAADDVDYDTTPDEWL